MKGIHFPEIGKKISPVMIDTIFGHGGMGMFPYVFLPVYLWLLKIAKETSTTIGSKSLTYPSKIGNYIGWKPWTWKFIQQVPGGGLLNAYGLTNPGANECAKKIGKAHGKGFEVIPNVYPEFSKGLYETIVEIYCVIDALLSILGQQFWILTLNFSCPNSKEKIDQNMQECLYLLEQVATHYPWLKIIVKLSYVHPVEFAQEISRRKLANVIHAVNTVPFGLVYPDPGIISPLAGVGGGGVSGPPIRDMALERCCQIRKVVDLPMIFSGGVRYCDVEQCLGAGANAVAICTDVRNNPEKVGKVLREYNV